MTNQQSIQQNFVNQSSTEFASAGGVYSFQTLPKEIQDNLLRLQNNNGDYLRQNGRGNIWNIVFFVLAVLAFSFYLSIVLGVGISFQSVIGILAVGVVFLLWIAFFGRSVFETVKSRIGNRIYLTPTQLIQTRNGVVRYRELKDVGEIEFRTFRSRGGSTYFLKFKFYDNDFFEFVFPIGMVSSKTAEANAWKDKAETWRKYAVIAFQKRDAAYFNSWDIFQGLSQANTPVLKRRSNALTVLFLLLISFVLPILGLISYNVLNSRKYESEFWDKAASHTTVTPYLLYIKGTRGKRNAEAAQKINGFYDEAIKKVKENQAQGSDTKGVEIVLNLLESAKTRQDNEINLNLPLVTTKETADEVRRKLSLQFKKTFPDETLFIQEKQKDAATVNSKMSLMEIKITNPIQPAKIPNKQTKDNSNLDEVKSSEKKYDFNCLISVPDKPKYEFEIKSATIEDFNIELAKRLGLA